MAGRNHLRDCEEDDRHYTGLQHRVARWVYRKVHKDPRKARVLAVLETDRRLFVLGLALFVGGAVIQTSLEHLWAQVLGVSVNLIGCFLVFHNSYRLSVAIWLDAMTIIGLFLVRWSGHGYIVIDCRLPHDMWSGHVALGCPPSTRDIGERYSYS